MTDREYFEARYIISDEGYLDYCNDPLEKYFLEKEMEREYDDSCWLFNKPSSGLEDDYGEESEP